MTSGIGSRSGRRDYAYGAIKRWILEFLVDETLPCVEIARRVRLPQHVVARNLSALTSRGILQNVGTRRSALYKIAREV